MSIMPGEIYGLFVKHENVFCGDLSQWKDDDDFFDSTDFVLDKVMSLMVRLFFL